MCLVVLFVQCQSEGPRTKEDINSEVSALKTIEEKRAYLEDILDKLQELQLEKERLQFYPESDGEVESLNSYASELEAENLLKISAYFENFGYPSRPQLGQYAAVAPYAVIYYSDNPEDIIKEDEFRYFYGAYKFGDIPPDMFLSYLLSYYSKVKGQALSMNADIGTTENIKSVLDLLGIEQ